MVWILCAAMVPAALEAAPANESAPPVRVDLNQASADELTVVPGIGQAMARRIVEFREANGPFKRIEDLMKVRGIGEKSFQKLKPYFKIGKKK